MKHAMTTSMDYEETAENTLDLVKMLRAFAPASSGPTVKAPGRAETKEKVRNDNNRFIPCLGLILMP